MLNRSAHLIVRPLAPRSARWVRLVLRLLGLLAWLLLALLGLTATGCRATESVPAPTATIVPFPTFTSTPIIEATATPIAASLLPTISATLHDLQPWIAYNAEGILWLWQAGASRELTTVDADSLVAISTDRQWIAFRRERGLWAITADGEEERLLISAKAIAELSVNQPDNPRPLRHVAWLPQTHRLLLTTTLARVVQPKDALGPNFLLNLDHDLYSVDVDTGHIAHLAAPRGGGLVYPSPDGAWIAVVTAAQISVLRADGSEQKPLLDVPEVFTYSEAPFYAKPLWAADSQSLVVEIPPKDSLASAPEPTTIWQLWTDGRAPTQLARIVTGDMTVSIAPDLTRIGYTGRLNAQEPFGIHLANIDGAANQIFHTDRGGRFWEWLPDSAHFVYDRQNGGVTYLGHIDGRPAISLGSQAMQSRVWLDAKHFLFVPDSMGLWLGTIGERGVIKTHLIAASATTFDFTRLPPVATVLPTLSNDLITLPAPLYFLDNSGQIMRLETDGMTVHQITSEVTPIRDFDVAQTHGRLVYRADNQLIEFDPITGKRAVKVSIEPFSQVPEAERYIHHYIRQHARLLLSPRYTPDGSQIAYTQGGVNLIDSGFDETRPSRILTNTLWSLQKPAIATDDAVHWSDNTDHLRSYYALSWAPDGRKLAIAANLFEGSLYTIYDLASNSAIELWRDERSPLCCSWYWGRDSQSGWVAGSLQIHSGPGLFKVDTATGIPQEFELHPLRTADTDPSLPMLAAAAYQLTADRVRFWAGVGEWPTAIHMVAELDLLTPRVQWVQTDPTLRTMAAIALTDDPLWATDGSGAVTVLRKYQRGASMPGSGRVHWLSGDGIPIVDLGIDAQLLRWGPAKDSAAAGEGQ